MTLSVTERLPQRGLGRMRAVSFHQIGFVALATSVAMGMAHGAENSRPPLAGHVVSVSGTVLLRQDQKNDPGKARQLKPGDSIFEGDVINTSSDGKAKLLMQDRTILDVGSSALFHVSKFDKKQGENRDVELSMMYGSVRANVTKKLDAKGKFRIRTPSATMGVRGTQFIVASGLEGAPVAVPAQARSPAGGPSKGSPAPAPKTEVVVIDGKVEVRQEAKEPPKSGGRQLANAPAANQTVTLGAGQGIVADASSSASSFKPTALSTEQLGKALEVAKVEDNTFKAAIVLDAPKPGQGSGGQGGGAPMAGMNVTQDTIRDVVKDTATTMAGAGPMTIGNSGIVGTFGGSGGVFDRPPVDLVAGGLRRVRVIIKR